MFIKVESPAAGGGGKSSGNPYSSIRKRVASSHKRIRSQQTSRQSGTTTGSGHHGNMTGIAVASNLTASSQQAPNHAPASTTGRQGSVAVCLTHLGVK
ncbi:hypothetical protein CCHOA_10195 [Corynebacterium choanae]|uniref:Uncharacterized protein n=1 Tax=Corynebacterium choanae TaxID=1862358 RepID=A0A3G6J9H3_9CORY|nr:hypothetical protein CCHOA_10195 [Corynebacterium choanae]